MGQKAKAHTAARQGNKSPQARSFSPRLGAMTAMPYCPPASPNRRSMSCAARPASSGRSLSLSLMARWK